MATFRRSSLKPASAEVPFLTLPTSWDRVTGFSTLPEPELEAESGSGEEGEEEGEVREGWTRK